MFPQRGVFFTFWLLWAGVASAPASAGEQAADPAAAAPESAAPEPIRMATSAFGVAPEVEVRDLPPGGYLLEIRGGSFGTQYLLEWPTVPVDTDGDGIPKRRSPRFLP